MSFFGKKAQLSPSTSTSPVTSPTTTPRRVGGKKLEHVTRSLLSSAGDRAESVRLSIRRALRCLGDKHPSEVLQYIYDYFTGNRKKLSNIQRTEVIGSAREICDSKQEELGSELVLLLLNWANTEMTSSGDVEACELAVCLGRLFPNELFNSLMEHLKSGEIPHPLTITCVGEFAASNSLFFVRQMQGVLSRFMPLLGSVRKETYQAISANAFFSFGEAISFFKANAEDKNEVQNICMSLMAPLHPAFELFLSQRWVSSKSAEVRTSVLKAIGALSSAISTEALLDSAPRLFALFPDRLKKEKPIHHLPMLKSFAMVLDAMVEAHVPLLSTHLSTLFSSLQGEIITGFFAGETGEDNPDAFRVQHEALRCCEILARECTDQVLFLLERQVVDRDATHRSAALLIFRQLVSRLSTELSSMRDRIVSVLKGRKQEHVLRVKQTLAQCVIALGGEGYLQLEGGKDLLLVVLEGCAVSDSVVLQHEIKKSPKKGKLQDVSPGEYRETCDRVLSLFTSTVEKSNEVLWPYLLEVVCEQSFEGCLGIVFKSLAEITSDSSKLTILKTLYENDQNVPRPEIVFASCFIRLMDKDGRNELAEHAYSFLKNFLRILPGMFSYEDIPDDLPEQEDELLILLRMLVESSTDAQHIQQSAFSFCEIMTRAEREETRRFGFLCCGTVLNVVDQKELIISSLEKIYDSCNWNSDVELNGLALSFGIVADRHLDMVLDRLQYYLTRPAQKKKLFGKKSDSSQVIGFKGKGFAALAIGYTAQYAPVHAVDSRCTVHLVNPLMNALLNAKSDIERHYMLGGIRQIAVAMRNGGKSIAPRDDVIKRLLRTASFPASTTSIKADAIKACCELVYLNPPMSDEMKELLFQTIFSLYDFDHSSQDGVDDLYEATSACISAVLTMEPSVDMMFIILRGLRQFISSPKPHHRERSCNAAVVLMKTLARCIADGAVHVDEPGLPSHGAYLSWFVPRCADSSPSVRARAVECCYLLLRIDLFLKSSDSVPDALNRFQDVRDRLSECSNTDLFINVREFGNLLVALVEDSQVYEILSGLVAAFVDPVTESSSGAGVVVNAFIRHRGEQLGDGLYELGRNILTIMSRISNEQTMNGAHHAIKGLAKYESLGVYNILLESPRPHPPYVVKAIQTVATDSSGIDEIITYSLDVLNNGQLYKEEAEVDKKKRKSKKGEEIDIRQDIPLKEAVELPCSVTCAIGEMFEMKSLSSTAKENIESLVSTLCMRIGVCHFAKGKEQLIDEAFTALRNVLSSADMNLDVMSINSEDDHRYLEPLEKSIASMVHSIHAEEEERVVSLYEFNFGFLTRSYPGQVQVSTMIMGQLLQHMSSECSVMDSAVNALLLKTGVDEYSVVRVQALKGLSFVKKPNVFATPIISALMAAVDDSDDNVSLQALESMNVLFEQVDLQFVMCVLVSVCLRLRLAFDRDNPDIRSSGFELFGILHRFIEAASDSFEEQVHSNLSSILVHVNDVSHDVRSACKNSLRLLVPLLGSEKLKELLNERFFDPVSEYFLDYDEFAGRFSSVFAIAIPERVNMLVLGSLAQFKSKWPEIRSAAALMCGHILHSLDQSVRSIMSGLHLSIFSLILVQSRTQVNVDQVISGLVALLSDSEACVKESVAVALGLLHDY